MPCGVSMYFCVVTREMVDSCISMESAISERIMGFISSAPPSKKSRCFSTMQRATLRSVSFLVSRLLMIHLASCRLFLTYCRSLVVPLFAILA